MGDTAKKSRTANFSSSEKELLFSLIAKYKNVIENKKTDGTTNEEKQKTWEKVTQEFNACCPDSRHRTCISLKKFYNNKKKDIRKAVAEENRQIIMTGGGTVKLQQNQDTADSMLLSIINKKSIFGVPNAYDSDNPNQDLNLDHEIEETERVLEEEENEYISMQPSPKRTRSDSEAGPSNWSQPSARMLSHSVSTSLRNATSSVSRRRPATVVKSLTSSAVAEKYNLLLNKRMAIADYEMKKLEEDLIWQKKKQSLEEQLLLVKLEIEKEKLKKLQEANC